MINLALLGAWHVHTWMYLPILLKDYVGEVCFTVVWDTDIARGKAAAQKLGAAFEKNLENAIKTYKCDAVIVQCETMFHREAVVQAARAGKHIFCEKVLAASTEDCLAMQQAINAANVKFMVSLDALSYGIYAFVKQIILQGKLGVVGSAYVRRVHGMAFGEEGGLPNYWYDNAQTGGGVTIDLGTHGASLLLFLFGMPQKVSCIMSQHLGNGQDDISSLIAMFPSGLIATSHTSFMAAHLDNYVEVIGTKGSICLTGFMGINRDKLRVYLQSNLMPAFNQPAIVPQSIIPKSSPLTINAFIQLLKSDEKELAGYGMQEAINLTRFIEAAYKSHNSGRTITIE